MRFFLLAAFLTFSGCNSGLTFDLSPDMTADQMLARASHDFVGVIEKQQLEPRLALPHDYWRVLRRRVRIEQVLRGSETRKVIDVYEIHWTGGTSGDWNFTQDGERDVFLLRVENGKYHVVRDWWRSIFPVISGPHTRLPLDDSRPLWERIALMNWQFQRTDADTRIRIFSSHNDPGGALSQWRSVKLARGLVRHPLPVIRVEACRALLSLGWGQDECWDTLPASERMLLGDRGATMQDHNAEFWWKVYTNRDDRRLFTAVNDRKLRAEFCRRYTREYPGDTDVACPADRPPPASIVTDDGDVPLLGPWPH